MIIIKLNYKRTRGQSLLNNNRENQGNHYREASPSPIGTCKNDFNYYLL